MPQAGVDTYDSPPTRAFIYGAMAWTHRELHPPSVGLVGEVGEGDIHLFTEVGDERMDLAEEVYLLGTPSLEALVRPLRDGYVTAWDAEGERYILDGGEREIEVRGDRFLGDLGDLLDAVWARSTVDEDGSALHAVEMLEWSAIDFGLFEEWGVDVNGHYLRLLVDGARVDLPADMDAGEVFGEVGSGILEQFVVPTLDADGSVVSLESLTPAPLFSCGGAQAEIVGVLPAHDRVVLRSDEGSPDGIYHLGASPWIFDSDGIPVGLGDLEGGTIVTAQDCEGTLILVMVE